MVEITCQGAEVEVVPVGELRVIRAVTAGVVINVPMTALALAALIADCAISAAA